jgi:AraC-like DNA-binding protein
MEKQAYTVAEVATMTGFSRQTVTRIFERERGVLIVGHSKTEKDKRSYRSIRIPRAVYERVIGTSNTMEPDARPITTFAMSR